MVPFFQFLTFLLKAKLSLGDVLGFGSAAERLLGFHLVGVDKSPTGRTFRDSGGFREYLGLPVA